LTLAKYRVEMGGVRVEFEKLHTDDEEF
jgi:hypothetical protein